MVKMTFINRFVIVVLACSVDHSFAEDKRLLLNDPETLLSQIHALQQELQELKSSTTEKFRLLESQNQIQGLFHSFFSWIFNWDIIDLRNIYWQYRKVFICYLRKNNGQRLTFCWHRCLQRMEIPFSKNLFYAMYRIFTHDKHSIWYSPEIA